MPKTAKAPENCVNCGAYKLCQSVGGDTNFSGLDTLVKSRRIIKRGDFVYRTGDPFRAIYAIRGGSVKTYIIADDGRIQVTGFHVAGSVLGLDSMATSQYNCDAIALESTGVCEVPFVRFQELSKRIPSLQHQMLGILSQEILDNRNLILLLGKMNGEQRLAAFLLRISRRFERRGDSHRQFNMSMSRSDIGNYLGMAEETICRILARFQEEGLIAVQRRKVTLNDLDRLAAVASRNRPAPPQSKLPRPQLQQFDVTDRAMPASRSKPIVYWPSATKVR